MVPLTSAKCVKSPSEGKCQTYFKKNTTFYKKINASVYKHKERLLWMENTKGRCENEKLERCI